jgi:DHA3 family tetracycline resistance protein-like MFS transporter
VKRPSATTVYYGLEFLLSMPTWIVVALYLVQDLGLSPFELVVMGTAMEAAVFLFEIPTGVVADTYGRKLSLVIGFAGMGATWLLVGVASTAWVIFVLWGLWGISYTFTSGAYQAWITDEVGVERVPHVFLRGARFSYAGAFLGLFLSVLIGTQSLQAAVIAGGAVSIVCAVGSLLLMPETGFRRRPREERAGAFEELRTTALAGGRFVRAQPVLLMLLGIAFFIGTASEAFDRLKEAHFIREIGLPSVGGLDPVFWFGAFTAVSMLFGFFAVGVLLRRFERRGTEGIAKLLFAFTATLAAAQLVFALTGAAAVAIVSLLVSLLARQLIFPLWDTWVNQQITDSSVRATVNSITGQADAVGQAAGGPVLGLVGNRWGTGAALGVGALLLTPALALYGRAIRHRGREPELEDLPAGAAP